MAVEVDRPHLLHLVTPIGIRHLDLKATIDSQTLYFLDEEVPKEVLWQESVYHTFTMVAIACCFARALACSWLSLQNDFESRLFGQVIQDL